MCACACCIHSIYVVPIKTWQSNQNVEVHRSELQSLVATTEVSIAPGPVLWFSVVET